MISFFLLSTILSLNYISCPDLISIQLEDETVISSKRSYYTDNNTLLEDNSAAAYYRFKVDREFSTSLTGHKYYSESEYYDSKNCPINVDVYNDDKIIISFDDNKDGKYDDRDTIITSLENSVSTHLHYNHEKDVSKNIKIPCRLLIEHIGDGYRLKILYETKSKGIIKINKKEVPIFFWKSLMEFDLYVNGQEIKRGNPFRLGKEFYSVKSYDPIANTLSIYKLDRSEKLYGTAKNLHVKKELLHEAFTYHNIDKTDIAKKDYHIFYFWGHWCPPCMIKMEDTSKTLGAVKENMAVYNVSLITKNYEDEVSIVKDIVWNYNLPGHALIEKHSLSSNTYPIIQLLDNRSYPGYVVLDSEYKIIYLSDKSNVPFEEFIKTLE